MKTKFPQTSTSKLHALRAYVQMLSLIDNFSEACFFQQYGNQTEPLKRAKTIQNLEI